MGCRDFLLVILGWLDDVLELLFFFLLWTVLVVLFVVVVMLCDEGALIVLLDAQQTAVVNAIVFVILIGAIFLGVMVLLT